MSKKVSEIGGDVLFYHSKQKYLTNVHCTSSAANQTAAAPTRISRILQNQLEAAKMAKRTEKWRVILLKYALFYHNN